MGHLNQHLSFDHCKPKGQEVVDNETSVISVVRLLTLMIRQKSKISVERLSTHIGFVNRYIIFDTDHDLFQSYWGWFQLVRKSSGV